MIGTSIIYFCGKQTGKLAAVTSVLAGEKDQYPGHNHLPHRILSG